MQMTFGVQKDFVVGANALNSTTINTFLPADMACLRFYNRVLSRSRDFGDIQCRNVIYRR